jgi:hypothetical protein
MEDWKTTTEIRVCCHIADDVQPVRGSLGPSHNGPNPSGGRVLIGTRSKQTLSCVYMVGATGFEPVTTAL